MGIFDYIKSVGDVLSTRSGRENMLGIPANKRDRALRVKAVKDFSERNPNFLLSGDMLDYDGYVQYTCDGQTYCVFIEGAREVWKFRDHQLQKLGHGSAYLETIDNQLIPEIKNLFVEHANYWKRRANEERVLVNIVLAQIWLDDQFKNCSDIKNLKTEIYYKFIDLINNHEIPFYSIEEISRGQAFFELLIISKILKTEGIDTSYLISDLKLSEVDKYLFDDLQKRNASSIKFVADDIHGWCKHLKHDHGIIVECDFDLGVKNWY